MASNLTQGVDQHNAFMQPYIWNQFLGIMQRTILFSCNLIGGFGEMLYNDNGEMMARCFTSMPGMVVNYESKWDTKKSNF